MKSIASASRSMARPATLTGKLLAGLMNELRIVAIQRAGKLKQLLKSVAQSFEKDNDAEN